LNPPFLNLLLKVLFTQSHHEIKILITIHQAELLGAQGVDAVFIVDDDGQGALAKGISSQRRHPFSVFMSASPF